KAKGKEGKHSSLIGWIDLSGPKSVEKHRKKVRRWARETEVEEEEEEMERGGVLELSCLHLCVCVCMCVCLGMLVCVCLSVRYVGKCVSVCGVFAGLICWAVSGRVNRV